MLFPPTHVAIFCCGKILIGGRWLEVDTMVPDDDTLVDTVVVVSDSLADVIPCMSGSE